MNTTFRLGRVAGVPIGVSWTWLVVAALVVWTLDRAVFPSLSAGHAPLTYLVMAFVGTLLFFGSVLLHELGHAVRARREGVPIDGITLWLLGGVARFRGTLPSAGAEFRIAIAGPIVTAGLALVFGAATSVAHASTPLDAVLAWLASVNVLVLAFNLLPALPLDGGRLLRSGIWWATGDLRRSTRIAASVAVGLAAVMIGGGLLLLLTGGGYAGVWLALVGWFVWAGARAEGRVAAFSGMFEGLVAADLMTPHPPAAQAEQPLRDFLAGLPSNDALPAYPVLDGAEPVGILTVPVRVAGSGGDGPAPAPVRERMQPLDRVAVLEADDPAPDAILALTSGGEDAAALVLDAGRVAGILVLRDLLEALEYGERGRPRSAAPGVSARADEAADGRPGSNVPGRSPSVSRVRPMSGDAERRHARR